VTRCTLHNTSPIVHRWKEKGGSRRCILCFPGTTCLGGYISLHLLVLLRSIFSYHHPSSPFCLSFLFGAPIEGCIDRVTRYTYFVCLLFSNFSTPCDPLLQTYHRLLVWPLYQQQFLCLRITRITRFLVSSSDCNVAHKVENKDAPI